MTLDDDNTEAMSEQSSVLYVDASIDPEQAIKQLQGMVQDLRLELKGALHQIEEITDTNNFLCDKLYGNQSYKKEQKSTRYYAIVRGWYNPQTKQFARGITTDYDELKRLTNGAWKNKHQGFSTQHEAEQFLLEYAEAADEENQANINDDGTFSECWYAVWSTETSWYTVVPTSEEATALTTGRAGIKQKKRLTYLAAVAYAQAESAKEPLST